MLPQKVLYKNKIESSYARNFQSNIAPQNKNTANVNETTIINIPCVANQFLSGQDSLLAFTLNLRNAGADALTYCRLGKAGAAGLIQRVRIFHGSTLLQDIDQYAQLMAMLHPLQLSSDDCNGKNAILSGTAVGGGRFVGTDNTNVLAATTNVSHNFAIPLMSILSMTDSYVPCWALTSAPIRLEIQWVSNINKAICSSHVLTTSSTLISDIKYIANFVELNDSGMSKVKAVSNGAVEWVTQAYSNYQYNTTLGTSETQLSVPVPAKYNSLKALYATFRQYADGVATKFCDDSPSYALVEYSTRIGSQVVPSEKPKSTPEFLSELERALGSVGNRVSPSSYLAVQYEALAPVSGGTGTTPGCFAVGVETESYSSAEMGSVYQGMNTSNSDIFFQPKFGAQGAAVNVLVDVFASYDQLITIQDGMAVVQF